MTWDPPGGGVDYRNDSDVRRHWRAIHRCAAAYRRRVRLELLTDPPIHRQVGQLGVPLCDLELRREAQPDDLVPVWLASQPAAARHKADHLLRRGTLLRVTGWTGDQNEALEVQTWQVVDGSFGAAAIHTPLGGRYGGVGGLVDALIVEPNEPIAGDERRAEALLADLAELAAVVTTEPEPPLPETVLRLLGESSGLDAARLSSLANAPSDHWADTELRRLEQRAGQLVADMDPVGLLGVLQEAVSEQLRVAAGMTKPGFPMNFLVWQSLHRAAVGLLAPGLTPAERTRLGDGWQAVKARAK